MKINILVIDTDANLVWKSMEEVLPSLKNAWLSLDKERSFCVKATNIDQINSASLVKNLVWADKIVFLAFNAKIANCLNFLRLTLGLKTPIVLHLHQLASYGCWPLFEFKLHQVITNSDSFIATSESDCECFREVFKSPNIEYISYPLFKVNLAKESLQKSHSEKLNNNFIYFGRITAQKNLHTLVWMLSLAKKDGHKFSFDIFGSEDNWGSPNMGIEESDYLQFLRRLVNRLGLNDDVVIHPYKPRDELFSHINNTKPTYLSLSLHSDENFGFAPARALQLGSKAFLSKWGGHMTLNDIFTQQVELVPVSLGKYGPFVDVNKAYEVFKNIINSKRQSKKIINEYVTPVIEKMGSFIKKKYTNSEIIGLGVAGREVLDRRNLYKDHETKVFKNYQDALAHKFFKSYGAIWNENECFHGIKTPWSNLEKDPHLDFSHRELYD